MWLEASRLQHQDRCSIKWNLPTSCFHYTCSYRSHFPHIFTLFLEVSGITEGRGIRKITTDSPLLHSILCSPLLFCLKSGQVSRCDGVRLLSRCYQTTLTDNVIEKDTDILDHWSYGLGSLKYASSPIRTKLKQSSSSRSI